MIEERPHPEVPPQESFLRRNKWKIGGMAIGACLGLVVDYHTVQSLHEVVTLTAQNHLANQPVTEPEPFALEVAGLVFWPVTGAGAGLVFGRLIDNARS